MTLVFVTQLLDPEDPVLGFVTRQLSVLAERVDDLAVIANEVHAIPAGLDADIISLGKERHHGRVQRVLAYQAALARLGRRRDVTLLAHMCPAYVTAAAPIARARGMRSLLWFTHQDRSRKLAVAERLADEVLTAMPGSYPRASPKVRVVGHAIDTGRLVRAPALPSGPLTFLALGRTAPAKGLDVAIRAVRRASERGADVRLRIVGPSTTDAERQHVAELEQEIRRLDLADVVSLEGPVNRSDVPALLSEVGVLLNAHADGSADKVVFEALASGRPALACTRAFDDLLGGLAVRLTFPQGDVDALVDRIVELADQPRAALDTAGDELRRRVVAAHSLEHWADEVAASCQRSAA